MRTIVISRYLNRKGPEGVLLILSTLGVVLVLLCTSRYGVGILPDSVDYLAAAQNLVLGEGLRTYDGSPYVGRPPDERQLKVPKNDN
jgi:hypothetical protein